MMRPSLLRHLLLWALGALVLVWASFVAVGFKTGEHEADELTDGHLASMAALLLDEPVSALVPAGGASGPGLSRELATLHELQDLKSHDYQQSMSMVVWDRAGRLLSHRGEAPVPPFTQDEGFADLRLGQPPAVWRSFAKWDGAAHARKVMVMLSAQERDDLAFDIAGQVALPGLWLLPFIALAVALAIQRGLRPLHDLSRDVGELNVFQATHLQTQHPQEEFAAVVGSINTLVDRHRAALMRERQLASEFAHELRTPLSSIALHASSLRGSMSEAEREASLQRLEHDALRAGEVVTQLLALARASRTELDEAAQPVDLGALCAGVVAEYAQGALESGHELALVSSGEFGVAGHPVLLELALRNLVDNALDHTPRGSLVEVQLDTAARWLQVCDTGVSPSATSDAERLKTYGLGLGLGHRVVEKVAAVHGARFGAVPAPPGFASCYRISFEPMATSVA